MKRYLGLILGFTVISLLGLPSVGAQDSGALSTNYQNKVSQLFQMIQLRHHHVDERLPYQTMYKTLEEFCSHDDIAYASDKLQEFLEDPTTQAFFKYNNRIRRQIKFDTTKRQMIDTLDKTDPKNCAKEYFLLQTLELIQGLDTLPPLIQVQNSSSSDNLISDLSVFYIDQRLRKLVADKIFTPAEIQALNNKIHITYANSCGPTHGSFHMLAWSSGRREVSKIVLTINNCKQAHYLNDFSRYIDQILVHELGHYLYYFKDTHHQDFDDLCWKHKNLCTYEDFVSRYAQTSSEEDYAESFAYRYLIVKPNNSSDAPEQKPDPSNRVSRSKRNRKNDYFNELFGIV